MRKALRTRVVATAALACLAVAGVVVVVAATHSHRTSSAPRAPARTSRHRPSTTVRRRVRGPHVAPVPILMYHVIARPPSGAPFPDLYVPPTEFAGQVRWLAAHGYHAVTLRAVYDYWRDGFALPRKPIVLTFDDGYRSTSSVAFPVLRRHGWVGVVNLKIDNTRDRWGLPPRLVRRLIAAGWEIDAHTFTHPDLTTVDAVRLRREVAGSRAWLRRTFHVRVDFFCYPSGRYDAGVVAAVRAAGYLGATTTDYGLARPDEPFTLDRVRVNGSDGVGGFAEKLTKLS